jgi:hypothetical protein
MSQFSTNFSLWLDVSNRKADLTYDLADTSLTAIENVSPNLGSVYKDPGTYMYVFEKILPRYPASPLVDRYGQFSFELMTHLYFQTAISLSKPGTISRPHLKLLMLPWTLPQRFFNQILVTVRMSNDQHVNATYCRQTYKVTVDPSSFYAFSVFCLLTLAWCLGHLILTIFTASPVMTLFPDVDRWSESIGNVPEQIVSRLSTKRFTSSTIEKKMWDTRVRMVPMHKNRWDETDYEMNSH